VKITVKNIRFSIFALCLLASTALAQNSPVAVPPPEIQDFAGTLTFLSSDWMEGREPGFLGNYMAADYIASMMQMNGLDPIGDIKSNQRSYLQHFEIRLYYPEKTGSLYLILGRPGRAVVSNVTGMIRGKDTTKSIVVGAHYDHLGIRNGLIYNGSDDNASGVAGMLALAKHWCVHNEKPACNLIFAAWNCEETGKHGSRYFVRHTEANPRNVIAYINMDMISRSAPEDTNRRIISIGTRPESENLRGIAVAANKNLMHPFELDLWDVTGHSGSDYSPFTDVNIPVMTFFSGFQVDYHTPEDDADKADLNKMEDILKIVNNCLIQLQGTFRNE